jgi:hypothetical protein
LAFVNHGSKLLFGQKLPTGPKRVSFGKEDWNIIGYFSAIAAQFESRLLNFSTVANHVLPPTLSLLPIKALEPQITSDKK